MPISISNADALALLGESNYSKFPCGEGLAEAIADRASRERAKLTARILAQPFLTSTAVMGCETPVSFSAACSLDDGPQVIGVHSHGGEFPAIYAPAITRWQAEALLTLLDDAHDDDEIGSLREALYIVVEAQR